MHGGYFQTSFGSFHIWRPQNFGICWPLPSLCLQNLNCLSANLLHFLTPPLLCGRNIWKFPLPIRGNRGADHVVRPSSNCCHWKSTVLLSFTVGQNKKVLSHLSLAARSLRKQLIPQDWMASIIKGGVIPQESEVTGYKVTKLCGTGWHLRKVPNGYCECDKLDIVIYLFGKMQKCHIWLLRQCYQ